MLQRPFGFFLWMCTSRQGSSVSSEDRGARSKLHDLYCSTYRSLHLLWEDSKLNPACVFHFFSSPLSLSHVSFPPLLFSFSLMCSLRCKAIQGWRNRFLYLFALNCWVRVFWAEPFCNGIGRLFTQKKFQSWFLLQSSFILSVCCVFQWVVVGL